MVKKPTVSIIVPVFNLETYISKCLDSLLFQTYKQLEIIVVDDGSSDTSWDIISAYQERDNRIIALVQDNGGAGKARNTGLDRMTGSFFMFVDGDDFLSPDTIESNMGFFIEDIALDWISFPVVRVDKDGSKLILPKKYQGYLPKEATIINKNDLIPLYLDGGLSGLACGSIYRWSTLKEVRFPENEYYEDSFYFIDLLVQTNKLFISRFGVYQYVEREGSAQLMKTNETRLASNMKCMIKEIRELSILMPELHVTYQEKESEMYYLLKVAISKKMPNAKRMLEYFISQMKYPVKLNLAEEFRFFCYKSIGYERIMVLCRKLSIIRDKYF